MNKKIMSLIFILFLFAIIVGIYLFLPNNSYINIYTIFNDVKVLDLSHKDLSDIEKLLDNPDNFKRIDKITFRDVPVPEEVVNKIKQAYPNMDIDVITLYDFYGRNIREDVSILNLSDKNFKEEYIDDLAKFKKLIEVDFGHQRVSLENQIKLVDKYPNVYFKWEVKILDKLYPYDTEFLDLSDKKIDNIDTLYKSITLLKKLKKIDLSNSNLTNDQLGQMREDFENIRIDWVVRFGKWSLRTDAVAFSVLITDYTHKRLTSDDVEVLKYCTELQALDLGHQAITNIEFISKYLKNLRVLILADNKITDISPLKNLKHLHYLELFMNNISDFTPLENLKELVDLNICFNPTSDVTPILNLPKLERLWTVGTYIPRSGYDKIRSTYPKIELVTTGKGSTESGWRTHKRYFALIRMFNDRTYISDEFAKYDS